MRDSTLAPSTHHQQQPAAANPSQPQQPATTAKEASPQVRARWENVERLQIGQCAGCKSDC
eukprot:1348793-Amphidinium_carterae.1